MSELIVLHELQQSFSDDKYKRYSEQLLALLSDQWPRLASTGAQMLAQLNDDFPIVLALVDGASDSVIAALKLSRVGSSVIPTGTAMDDMPADLSTALLLQNVIVQRSLRGAGLGRRLLSATEAFVARKGFRSLCLGTNDQVPFYARCGFRVLPSGVSFAPSTASAAKLDSAQIGALLAAFGGGAAGSAAQADAPQADANVSDVSDNAKVVDALSVNKSAPAPPPAPKRKVAKASSEQARRNDCDSWMAKRIELDEKQCKCDNVI